MTFFINLFVIKITSNLYSYHYSKIYLPLGISYWYDKSEVRWGDSIVKKSK